MSQLKVLVADDNADLAKILNIYLSDAGYEVIVTYNGADTIKALRSEDFDAVLLDVKLPDMNGIEILQEIYNTKPQTRVYMMTGYRCEQIMKEVVGNGTVQVVYSQSDAEPVLEIIKTLEDGSIVLVLDSDFSMREEIFGHFADRGIDVFIAHDAREAIDNVLSNPVKLLLLDLDKPIVNSLGIYVELKKQGHTVKTVIFAGGLSDADEASDILETTAITGCLFKPFDPEELISMLEKG